MANETVFTPPVQLRRYYLPHLHGEGWGVFVIGSDGYFSVISDYGNYAYFWTHAGMEFRAFLIRLDWHYVATKIRAGQRGPINSEKSIQRAHERIAQIRREGSISKEDAREEWDRTSALDWLDEVDFTDWARESKLEFDGACECRVNDEFPGDAEAFAKKLLPRFQAVLRAELAGEAIDPVLVASHA